ncbi:MAG: hypothetical protein P4L76_05420 [Beijerinckiaceae bacterium]|nr:hypothetical protein [Beijerinckiaceae bacterium]
MTTINEFIEDWIQIRSTFQRQIKTLESVHIHVETGIPATTTKETVVRLKVWVGELNKLLKEHAQAQNFTKVE